MERKYTNEELAHLIIDFKLEVKGDMSEIKEQVMKTNGRVNKLENWRWFITGGLAILGIVLIPIALAIIQLYK